MIKETDFTRAKNLDVNGNPRYILHFLSMTKPGDAPDGDISGKYAAALVRARKFGGRKYHNKSYGGGIIFQSYNTNSLADDLNNEIRGAVVWQELWDAMEAAPTAWIETTHAMYWDMLEVLPRVAMSRRNFLVGEAHSDNAYGEPLYACFKKIGDRYYARYLTIAQFQFV
jgi:hypothetical protein